MTKDEVYAAFAEWVESIDFDTLEVSANWSRNESGNFAEANGSTASFIVYAHTPWPEVEGINGTPTAFYH